MFCITTSSESFLSTNHVLTVFDFSYKFSTPINSWQLVQSVETLTLEIQTEVTRWNYIYLSFLQALPSHKFQRCWSCKMFTWYQIHDTSTWFSIKRRNISVSGEQTYNISLNSPGNHRCKNLICNQCIGFFRWMFIIKIMIFYWSFRYNQPLVFKIA